MKKSFNVDSTFNDMRIDRWIRNNLGNYPQGLIEKSLKSGKVKINNKKVKSSRKVKTGDIVELDVSQRSINMLVDEDTLSLRRNQLKPLEPKAGRGWLWMYSNHVKQANEGCDFDFLETDFGKSAKEPDIF